MKFKRIYDNLKDFLEEGKAVIIFGPRQAGKTTLIRSFLSQTDLKYKFVVGDDMIASNILSVADLDKLRNFIGDIDLLVVDEAQMVPNIGKTFKLLIDSLPKLRILATGSSSFELAGQMGEPLVGRKKTLTLYPLSCYELEKQFGGYDVTTRLSKLLLYGTYPAVLNSEYDNNKIDILNDYVSSFLLKDIMALENVKGSKSLFDLLRLIAYQIGGEVSYSELGRQLGLDYKTVARYLDILEKGFVLYNLHGYSRNLRKEITKKSKYYFWDIGVRNAIISNFNTIESRQDVGQLWENFMVMERLKFQSYCPLRANNYFWRTWDKYEIDFVEERGGKLFGFEFKYNSNDLKSKKKFLETYPTSELVVVNKDNFINFVSDN